MNKLIPCSVAKGEQYISEIIKTWLKDSFYLVWWILLWSLHFQAWLTCNFSLEYPFIIQQTGNEKTQSYQVQVANLDLTPYSHNLFTRNCLAAKGEN